MDNAEAIEWITGDAAEMAELLREAKPDQAVPACPGWNASDLSRHLVVGFSAWYPYNISTPAESWSGDGLMARFAQVGDEHLSNIDAFEAGVAEFLSYCADGDLARDTWAFGGVEPAGWWIRRAGTELTVHLTDAADMLGRRASTSPDGHCEAIDEVTSQMFSRIAAVKQTMAALSGESADPPVTPDRAAALVADDTGRAWTLQRAHDGRATQAHGLHDGVAAVGHGSSADLLAWLHGRPMSAALTIEGDARLLDDWNLFQLAQL